MPMNVKSRPIVAFSMGRPVIAELVEDLL